MTKLFLLSSNHAHDSPTPLLVVKDLKHGADARGAVGLFVDIGTEAFFKDLQIIQED